MIKLTTSEKTELIVTPKHKVAIWNNDKITYVESNNIKEGEKVVAKPEEAEMKLTSQTITKVEKIQYKGKLYNVTTSSGNVIVNGILCKNSGGLGTPANQRVVAGMIHKAHLGDYSLTKLQLYIPERNTNYYRQSKKRNFQLPVSRNVPQEQWYVLSQYHATL